MPPNIRAPLLLVLPLGLWAMLWLAQGTGDLNVRAILHPGPSRSFLDAVRSLLPFAAANVALTIIIFGLYRQRSQNVLFFGPLGLTVLYGCAGVVASFLSPNGTAALYWAAAYISVPVVLWAIVWGPDALDRLQRLVNITWLFVVLFTVLLFFIALIELNLATLLAHPSELLNCDQKAAGDWNRLTSGLIRSTGVGRYAAIAGIVALGGLWRKSWRPVWVPVLVVSLILLLFTGSRTAMIGFAVAVPFIIFLSGGKKALIASAATAVILVPIFWATGIHDTFLNNCIFRSTRVVISDTTVKNPAGPSTIGGANLPTEVPTGPSTPGGANLPTEVPTGPSTPGGANLPTQVPTRVSTPGGASLPTRVSTGPSNPDAITHPTLVPSGPTAPDEPTPSAQGSVSGQPLSTPASSDGAQALAQPQTTQTPATQTGTGSASILKGESSDESKGRRVPASFRSLTGRTTVWKEALNIFKDSPVLGRGFHADRLLLNTHTHNSYVHALLQTGILGALPFMASLLFGWFLVYKAIRNLAHFTVAHRYLIIQSSAMLAFLTIRTITESTGAFFGIDWLLLCPLLLYLQVVNRDGAYPQHQKLQAAV